MTRPHLHRALFALPLFWSAQLTLPSPCAAAQLRVVTTTTDLASLARAVGGDRVEVEALVPGGFNADLYSPRPSDLFKIHKARLFIQIGLGLEEWARDLVNEANNPDLIKAETSPGIPLLDVPKGRVDFSFGDIHPYGNPHYQLDPEDGRIMARNISNALAYADPANKDYYDANLAAFDGRLTAAEAKWRAAMAPFEGAKFIPYHESWSYFARAFKLAIPDTIESKPGFVPSPRRVQEIIELAKREGVKLIVTEPYYDVSIARLVSQQAGIPYVSLTIDVGGNPAQKDYISMIDYIVTQFVQALNGHGG
jgi:zinc/manganese transport system substrate-binding protein